MFYYTILPARKVISFCEEASGVMLLPLADFAAQAHLLGCHNMQRFLVADSATPSKFRYQVVSHSKCPLCFDPNAAFEVYLTSLIPFKNGISFLCGPHRPRLPPFACVTTVTRKGHVEPLLIGVSLCAGTLRIQTSCAMELQ
jgi:hypothetical protein